MDETPESSNNSSAQVADSVEKQIGYVAAYLNLCLHCQTKN